MQFEISGSEAAEGVVLIHGWGSSAALMRPIASMLEERFRVLSVDLPGHGQTQDPTTAIGIPEFAEAIAELIRRELSPPVALVGHSNGGRIGLFMAAQPEYQSLIGKLALISPSGIRPSRSVRQVAKAGLAKFLKAPFAILPAPLREPALAWLRNSAIWRALGSSDYRSLTGVMRETFVKTVNTYLDDAVPRIESPTLILWGDHDMEIKRDQIDRLVDRIPDAGLVVLKGAGHYGYLDDPQTVSAALNHFLG